MMEFSRERALKPGYEYGEDVEWGLDLVLDGLERARRALSPRQPLRP